MKAWWILILAIPMHSYAQTKAAAPAGLLSLKDYLNQVQTLNPQGRAMAEMVKSSELRMEVEADSLTTTEMYGEAGVLDNQNEVVMPAMGYRTEGHGWKLGLRKQFALTGTSADLSYNSRWANITGASLMTQPNYYENKAVLELVQPLWRNSFGSELRGQVALKRADLRRKWMEAKYDLKNLLLQAENTYWSLVSYNQMIKLQEEAVERAKKMRDLMKNKTGLRLVDDVDYLQTQASLETRELELQNSQDERTNLIRQFNTLRGANTDVVETLAELPEKEFSTKFAPSKRITREDFEVLRSKAEMARAEAQAGGSHAQPQLDLVGSFSANGISSKSSDAYDEVVQNEHEYWMVGVRFSTPLDLSLLGGLSRAFKSQRQAAVDLKQAADFSLERTYSALSQQHGEAQKRLERAVSLETLQTTLVKRERARLLNGRTTTFQFINMEQNLAAAQIQKVQSQLSLVKVHNLLKTFEESP